ncbi:MAG: nuclear transport factor 2 family protein [Proteobacteria bacterium]|nr:nuclear transport factor 2 family protein [Pseudomonadota bacterium]
MSEHAAVLFANDAFYLAFANQDMDAMDALWSKETPVSCIHPGWDPLIDRYEVMESWKSILTNPTATNITCKKPTVRVFGELACVICHEVLDQGFLVATNLFVHEDGLWKIIHHQAGAAPPPEEDEDQDDPSNIMQ